MEVLEEKQSVQMSRDLPHPQRLCHEVSWYDAVIDVQKILCDVLHPLHTLGGMILVASDNASDYYFT